MTMSMIDIGFCLNGCVNLLLSQAISVQRDEYSGLCKNNGRKIVGADAWAT